ncbi:MAG: hypothetical protein ACLP0J_18925 [Solirubrobacteraceae bacterium]
MAQSAEVVERYRRWLASVPLAERSKREEVDYEGWGGDPLGDPLARDYAARDFKRFLKVDRECGRRP